MKMKKIFVVASSILAAAGFLQAGDSGSSVGIVLKMPAGARGAAMGEAFSAVADDASAITWNPAALADHRKRGITFMHAAYLESASFDYLAYGQPWGGKSGVGVAVSRLAAGSLTGRDASGFELGGIAPSDTVLSVGYGRQVKGASVGGAVKYLQSKIIDTASTVTADVGVLSPSWMSGRVRLAFVGANLGGSLKYGKRAESLPTSYRFGARYRLSARSLISVEEVFPSDGKPSTGVGFEAGLVRGEAVSLAVRAGYLARPEGETGASMGLGFAFRSWQVDYALVPMGDLGQTHRFSLSYSF